VIYLWDIAHDRTFEKLKQETAGALKRLLFRLEHELYNSRALLDKMAKLRAQQEQSNDALAGETATRLTPSEREQLKRVEQVRARLETAITRVTATYAVLEYF
jgi:septation ring formation regulator EzrA